MSEGLSERECKLKNEIHNHPNENARLEALRAMHILDTPIEERFERITRLARNSFNVPICAISCIDQNRVWFKSSQGLHKVQTNRGESFCQHTILQYETFIVEDARTNELFAGLPCVCDDPGFVFYAGTPIYSPNGMPIAAFCLVDTKPRAFNQQDIDMLDDFARLAEHELVANTTNEIEHDLINHVDESWRQTLIDPLTRLWNHEGIMMIAGEAVNQCRDSHTGMSMVMLDIKQFKAINSALGHTGGDEILKAFSLSLLQEVRKDDAVGRVHGNQFLIIMNSVSEKHRVRAAVKRFQSFVDSYQVHGMDGREHLQASIAAIRIPRNWTGNLQSLLEDLDGALYDSKRSPKSEPLILDAHFVTDDSDEQAA